MAKKEMVPEEQFSFPSQELNGKTVPAQTISASSLEEATQIWLKNNSLTSTYDENPGA